MNGEQLLTENGLEYIERVCDKFIEAYGAEEYRQIREQANLKGYGKHKFTAHGLPFEHPYFGELLNDTSQNFVLKHRGFSEEIDLTERYPDGRYTNQNVNEAHVFLDAKEQGIEKYFAPVRAFDAERGRWLIMEELDLTIPYHHNQLDWAHDKFEDMGWDSHDAEIGITEDQWVAYDYGKFSPLEDWLLSEEEVLESEIAVPGDREW